MIPIMKKTLEEWYSENPEISKDYCRIISNRHLDHLQVGGRSSPEDKFMEPTVVTGVGMDDSTMKV